MAFFQRLAERAGEIDSVLCVGLDPRVEPGGPDAFEQLVEHNHRIVEATRDFALCYKPNIAFYEQHGPAGLEAFAETLRLIDGVPVLLDAKRGDIGATAEAYARAYAQTYDGIGAVTVSPYMGPDSVEPFTRAGLAAFVLCRTSNTGAGELQDLRATRAGQTADDRGGPVASAGIPLYRLVAEAAARWPGEIGLVVAANDSTALRELRAAWPDTWFLAPGIGAQGGSMEAAVQAGLRADGLGLLPVVARGISAADDPGRAAEEYVDAFRATRDRLRSRESGMRGEPGTTAHAPAEHAAREPRSRDAELLDAILDTGCFRTGEFTLKSGIVSPFYVDLRRLQSDPRALEAAARAYAGLLAPVLAQRIAAIPVAALPLGTALALLARVPLIYPRLPAKPHGTGNRIEGAWSPGERAVLVDDLITTGLSKLEAVAVLREEGLVVEDLLVLIDRAGADGARELRDAGITLHAATTVTDLAIRARERRIVSEADARRVLEFLEEGR